MLKRLVAGLLEGGLVGLAVAFALGRLGLAWDSSFVVYGATMVMGVLTALVAGKPVWARGAKTEAAIKALAGGFIAAVSMFGIRKWLVSATPDLTALGAGSGPVGDLPFVALPLVGMALALVFEVDDAFGVEEPPPVKARVGAEPSPDEDAEASPEERQSLRRRG